MSRIVMLLMLACLAGCGVTQWQRDEDTKAKLFEMVRDLSSPEMEKAIQAAKPGVPRGP